VVDRVNEKPTDNPPGITQILPPRIVEFEVADLKPSRPDETNSYLRVSRGGGLEARNVSMRILIATAWDVDWDHVDEMVVGLPKWKDTANFDMVAKASTAANAPSPAGSGFIDDDIRLMLRALLIGRFQMKTHYEDRLANTYTLVAAKPKLKNGDPSNRASCKEARTIARDPRDLNPLLSRLISCRNITMAQFGSQLHRFAADYFAYDVADATGLEGAWDFTLSFTPHYLLRPNGGSGDAAQLADPSGALSIFDAVNKQLGLKLEMRKRPVPTRPTEQVVQAIVVCGLHSVSPTPRGSTMLSIPELTR
jgi:uncharacterized protein (TIGR03435 family)